MSEAMHMKKNNRAREILIALIFLFSLVLVGEAALVCLYPGGSGAVEPGVTTSGEPGRTGDSAPFDREAFTPPEGGNGPRDFTPEGGEEGNFPARGRTGEENSPTMEAAQPGLLGLLRRGWIPIVIVCAAGAGACGLLLLRLKKKKPEEAPRSTMPELQHEEEYRPPKSSGAAWVTAIAVLLTFAMILSSLPSGSTGSQTLVNTRVLSAQAETATIGTVLSGAGTLAGSDGIEAEIPDSVSVECYHVKNGSVVEAGDILASVSRTETASAIAGLQSVLEELDEDLNKERGETADSLVSATASGRVKAIYADEGDSAADVMYDRGALMLLSLDGLMAVDIPAGDLKAGDSVTVTLSDGTAQTGRVSQLLDGIATVTTADDTAPCDDAVIVADSEGSTLGSGTLYIHSQLRVTGFSGSVSRVNVTLNQKVTEGTRLITLKDTGYTFKYYRLLALRQELEETMLMLTKLNRDGYLRAEQSGQVSGIPEDGDYTPLGAGEDAVTASGLTAEEEPVRLVLLSDVPEGGGNGGEQPPENPGGDQEPSGGTVTYPASVSAIAGSTMILSITTTPVDLTAMDAQTALSVLPTQAISYTHDGVTPITDMDGTSLSASDLMAGDVLVITVSGDAGGNFSIGSIRRVVSAQPETPEGPSQGGSGMLPGGITIPGGVSIPGGMGGGNGSLGASASQEVYDTYSTGKTTVLTITPQEEMTISIQVDELDVLSVRTGLGAQVTLDALEGQSFAGTVTSIAREGENEGGNTKFAVEITLPKEESMLPGMNASVKIVTAVSDPVPTLPASALVEDGGHTFVYLGYDEKKDTLTDLTEIETGLSDGDRVQILSGLPEGSTVYYRYADTVVYSFTNG